MQLLYVYALIQIIFESLPVSSSGNVMLWIPLLQNLLELSPAQNSLLDLDFLLHLPTLFVLLFFFFRPVYCSVTQIRTRFNALLWLTGCCAVADTISVGFYFFWKYVGTAFFPLWVGFACTTFLLVSLRYAPLTPSKKQLLLADGAILGFVQGCALLPGISRLASTFVVGVWLGYKPERSFAYSFLLEVPLLGAALVKALWSVTHASAFEPLNDPAFYMVVLGGSVVSFCVLSLVFAMVKQKTVWRFAWYTALTMVMAKVLL